MWHGYLDRWDWQLHWKAISLCLASVCMNVFKSGNACAHCEKSMVTNTYVQATLLIVYFTCGDFHDFKWSSQPLTDKFYMEIWQLLLQLCLMVQTLVHWPCFRPRGTWSFYTDPHTRQGMEGAPDHPFRWQLQVCKERLCESLGVVAVTVQAF